MSEHTAGPWELEGSIYRGFKAAVSGGRPTRTVAHIVSFEDAKLIVRAVNAHDELLAALKHLLQHCDANPEGETTFERHVCEARAAIAKAEGVA